MRGPLVYCFEGVDNENKVRSLVIDTSEAVEASETDEALGGVLSLKVKALKREKSQGLYSSEKPALEAYTATAVPYYTWCNRGETDMRVWLPYK
jgi:DUF1680 family protein